MANNEIDNISIAEPNVALDPAINYQNLKTIGLQAIIDAGSTNWTDYNEHDPGITILETLIYGLTDLGYRTDFPIGDILAQQQLSSEELAKTQFYTARNILTTNPVTFNDLRKIIIDQEGVGNAWIQVANDAFHPVGGLLEILLDPLPEIKDKEQAKKLVEKVHSVFFRHRNLGQDLVQVILRKPLDIIVDLEVVVNPTAVAEQVLAQVLFGIENFLSSTVDFLTLQEMSNLVNGDVNQIFSGPALHHGFLPDTALLDYREVLRAVDIIPVLQDIPGVIVTNLLFQTFKLKEAEQNNQYSKGKAGNPATYWRSKLSLSKREKPRLASLSSLSLKVRKGKTPVEVNLLQLEFELNKLKNQQRKSKLAPQDRDFPIPLGNFRDIETYFSVQQEFPQIYGLQPLGPPPNASDTQLAQIKQLQAYLLVFDQIMANYLAQLANLGKLFSWDKKIHKTYFSQGLESAITDLGSLLLDDALLSKEAIANPSLRADWLMKNYQEKVAEFREDETTFLSRRNRFLNHLLARFGRTLTTYLESINQVSVAAQEKMAMETKLRILDQYSILSAQRARGFNLYRPEFPKEFSGLRQWIEALFDMEPESLASFHFNKRFAVNSFDPTANTWDAFSEYILVTEDGSPVDMKEIMRIGRDKDNYKVEYKKEKNQHHVVLYKPAGDGKADKVYRLTETFELPEQSLAAIDKLTNLVTKYNQTSERIYIVEHTLLRPTNNEAFFGLELLDENGVPWMQTFSWYAKNDLYAITQTPGHEKVYYEIIGLSDSNDDDQGQAEKSDNTPNSIFTFSILTDPDDKFPYKVALQFGKLGRTVKLISTDAYATKEIAERAIKQWMQDLEVYHQKPDLDASTLWRTTIKPWDEKPGYSNYRAVFKNPYSFILTVVIPDWPSRFQEKSFQKALEKELNNECPAHLWLNVLWLEKAEFQQFQGVFGEWWNAYSQQEPDAYLYRADLMDFIMDHSFPATSAES